MPQAPKVEQREVSAANTRWWEGYLVRYLIGTPIGGACLAVIAHEILRYEPFYKGYVTTLLVALSSGRATVDPTLAICAFVASLLYCYIASAPITIIHSMRMIREPWYSRWARYMWLVVWFLLLALVLLQMIVSMTTDTRIDRTEVLLWVLAVPATWITLMQMLCVLRLHADAITGPRATFLGKAYERFARTVAAFPEKSDADGAMEKGNARFEKFYFKLAAARSKASAKEIRESYTHMREHSNSVFIVAFEISLAALMVLLMRTCTDSWVPRAITSIAVVYVWLLPNVFLWSQANRLETALANGRT